ncbi:MAG: hypothetical protein LBU89_04450 [Fibromonadaceae bacterium]|jgi:hypothetical protein|nr:hypothetical protein [Fibromonadaceae bacterium]
MTIEPITPARTVIAQENEGNRTAKPGAVNAGEKLANEKLSNQSVNDGSIDNARGSASATGNMNDVKNIEEVDVRA